MSIVGYMVAIIFGIFMGMLAFELSEDDEDDDDHVGYT